VILKTLILISATYGKALELLKELAELLGYRNFFGSTHGLSTRGLSLLSDQAQGSNTEEISSD
jgi:hypothetical protein